MDGYKGEIITCVTNVHMQWSPAAEHKKGSVIIWINLGQIYFGIKFQQKPLVDYPVKTAYLRNINKLKLIYTMLKIL